MQNQFFSSDDNCPDMIDEFGNSLNTSSNTNRVASSSKNHCRGMFLITKYEYSIMKLRRFIEQEQNQYEN